MDRHIKTVYALKNDATGKLYIGSTSNNLYGRLHNHISALKGGRHVNADMQADFDNNPNATLSVFILGFEPPEGSLGVNLESYWIHMFQTNNPEYGYNRDSLGVIPKIDSFPKIFSGELGGFYAKSLTAESIGSLFLVGEDAGSDGAKQEYIVGGETNG